MPMPRRSHQTASLLKLNKACAEAKGTPLSLRMFGGQAALLKKPLKHRESVVFSGRRKRFTSEEKTAGVIGDGERITVLAIGEQELAFVISAPELIGPLSQR
jgi:hypothetical protein